MTAAAHVDVRELQHVTHLFTLPVAALAMTSEVKHRLVAEMTRHMQAFAERESLAIVRSQAAVRADGEGWRVVGLLEGVYAHRERERLDLERDLRFLTSR
jgi:hypothetical protein